VTSYFGHYKDSWSLSWAWLDENVFHRDSQGRGS